MTREWREPPVANAELGLLTSSNEHEACPRTCVRGAMSNKGYKPWLVPTARLYAAQAMVGPASHTSPGEPISIFFDKIMLG